MCWQIFRRNKPWKPVLVWAIDFCNSSSVYQESSSHMLHLRLVSVCMCTCICVCTCMCTCTCVCILQSCATLHTIRTNPCLFVPYCLTSLLKRLDWYRKTLTCRTRTDHNRSDYKQLARSTYVRRYYSFDPVDYRLLVLRPSDSPLRHVVMCQFMPLTHLAVRSSR